MNGWNPNRQTTRGFTLLEVLIATVAFAIVLAAINAVFYGALRLRNKTVQSIEESLPLRHALITIKRDLANLVLPGGALSGSLQTTSITNTVAGQASPEFFTASGSIDETSPWADVQKVSYALVPSNDRRAGLDLIRAVTRNLLPAGRMEVPAQQWLLSGVQTIGFAYFDGNQWRAWWDSTGADPTSGQTNAIPQAIKVQIQLASQEAAGRLSPVELVVPIMVQASAGQTSGGSQ